MAKNNSWDVSQNKAKSKAAKAVKKAVGSGDAEPQKRKMIRVSEAHHTKAKTKASDLKMGLQEYIEWLIDSV